MSPYAVGLLANGAVAGSALASRLDAVAFGSPEDAYAAATAGAGAAAARLSDLGLPDDLGSLLSSPDAALLGGAVALAAIPAALISLLGGIGGPAGPKPKGVPVATALEALAAEERCLLLDIRSKEDVKAQGSPNLKGVSKRGAVALPYTSVSHSACAGSCEGLCTPACACSLCLDSRNSTRQFHWLACPVCPPVCLPACLPTCLPACLLACLPACPFGLPAGERGG